MHCPLIPNFFCLSTMFHIELLASLALISFSCVFFFHVLKSKYVTSKSSISLSYKLPRSYPLIGSTVAFFANRDRADQWFTEVLSNTPSGTYVLRALGINQISTANPENVQHILKTHFSLYPKGESFSTVFADFLGSGIFNVDGNEWKFQRKVSSHGFSTRSLRNFVENVVETELSDRLLPILSAAAANTSVLDLQDILQRFAFDNICKIAFGHDPNYLSPSLPQSEFAVAFEDATMLTGKRFKSLIPFSWKLKRIFDIGSEKQLRLAISQIREFADNIIKKRKQELQDNSSVETSDLLSRFLTSGHSGKDFVTDMVTSFILAGRDTTSAALTWYFWLVCNDSRVEEELLKEISEKPVAPVYDEVKDLTYTQASLYESMRLYPPVPADNKEAAVDDVLPDGTLVKKGMIVAYHPYAMGRMEKLWGSDCLEFKPERWLKKDNISGKWHFVPKHSYTYPVFQAGPRICLGKEMAFLQMKSIVSGVLRRFRFVPVTDEEPLFISSMTAKMKGGFHVRVEERADGGVLSVK